MEPAALPASPGVELPWFSLAVAYVTDGLKSLWTPLAMLAGAFAVVFGDPWKWLRIVWDRIAGTRRPKPAFQPRRTEGEAHRRLPYVTIERFYGLFPGTASDRLTPGEAQFMAEYLQNAQDAGDVTGYARTHPDEFARFHVLAMRLLDLHRDPWRMQQEIALATGQVYPVWELLGVKAGSLDRTPSPLGLPPEAVFPSSADPAEAASLLASVLPGVGDYYDVATAIAGRDLFTGESLKWWERTLIGLGAAPFIPGKAIAEALGMIGQGGRAADLGRAMATDLIRKALPEMTEAGAANLVRFMAWADNRMMARPVAQATEELAAAGAGPLVAKWLSELEPEAAVRMIEHYRYNKQLLGALNEGRLGQQMKHLVADQKALLLHFNEAVNQGGADLIWIDLTSNRVVFVDVKSSVSGTTVSRADTFSKRMRKNIHHARALIDKSETLTAAQKAELRRMLKDGDVDLQVVLAGTARESVNLRANLLEALRGEYPDIQVRETLHLDR